MVAIFLNTKEQTRIVSSLFTWKMWNMEDTGGEKQELEEWENHAEESLEQPREHPRQLE